MDELPFFLQPDYMACFACCCCEAKVDASPDWRWNGKIWEHRCNTVHPQCGSFEAVQIAPLPERLVENSDG